MLPLAGLGLHCDVVKKISKEASTITCTGALKYLNMDVVWYGYAQVYVQYYSSVDVEVKQTTASCNVCSPMCNGQDLGHALVGSSLLGVQVTQTSVMSYFPYY